MNIRASIGWNVYLNGKFIDCVYFMPDCDYDYVRKSLIDHDGYDGRIVIKRK